MQGGCVLKLESSSLKCSCTPLDIIYKSQQSSGNQSIHKDTMSSVNDDSPAIPSNKGQYPSLEVNTYVSL